MAACAQAAAVVWDGVASGLTDSKGAAVAAEKVISMYVYEIGAKDYATYAAMDAETLSKTIGALYENGKMPGTADGSSQNSYNKRTGAALKYQGTVSHVADTDTATAYGLILFTDANNEGWYMANAATITVEGAADVTVSALTTHLGGSDASRRATAWAQASAVPEPTSAMLLLLGMAGLALCRRRA